LTHVRAALDQPSINVRSTFDQRSAGRATCFVTSADHNAWRERNRKREGVASGPDQCAGGAAAPLGNRTGGGDIGFIDLGTAALIVPGGIAGARREVRRVLAARYDAGLASINDPDLTDQ